MLIIYNITKVVVVVKFQSQTNLGLRYNLNNNKNLKLHLPEVFVLMAVLQENFFCTIFCLELRQQESFASLCVGLGFL